MFEYIKKVGIAISFIAQKIETENNKIKDTLEQISLDLLLIAQNFKVEDLKVSDLKKLEKKISYLIDVVDFARISGLISSMNSKIFIDSQLAFLKHIINLIDQKNSLSIPMYQLKELDDVFARKNAKENLQNKFAQKSVSDYNFPNVPASDQNQNLNYTNIVLDSKSSASTSSNTKVLDVEIKKELQPKILEESIITPTEQTEYSTAEQEIKNRRARILKSLTLGGGSIKDIMHKLGDVSEKTVQRDLIELMHDKKVIMLGKKRWSKYYLK